MVHGPIFVENPDGSITEAIGPGNRTAFETQLRTALPHALPLSSFFEPVPT